MVVLTVGLCLRPYGGPMGVAVSHEGGTPVQVRAAGAVGCRQGIRGYTLSPEP